MHSWGLISQGSAWLLVLLPCGPFQGAVGGARLPNVLSRHSTSRWPHSLWVLVLTWQRRDSSAASSLRALFLGCSGFRLWLLLPAIVTICLALSIGFNPLCISLISLPLPWPKVLLWTFLLEQTNSLFSYVVLVTSTSILVVVTPDLGSLTDFLGPLSSWVLLSYSLAFYCSLID